VAAEQGGPPGEDPAVADVCGGWLPRPPESPRAWGSAGFRGVYAGRRTAPNGLPFHPLFSLDLDFNLWLWRSQGLYLFTEDRFWGQRSAPNVADGRWDFSKREFDLDLGAAWNYAGPWEARLFAYSLNNLNRGYSYAYPDGFKDGFGVENRLYLGPAYAGLGTDRYDIARADFVSLGYMPTKSLVGNAGDEFRPSLFAEAYLTQDLWGPSCYLFLDARLITQRPVTLRLLDTDAGLALRPFRRADRLEFRAGAETAWDVSERSARPLGYLSVRYVY
jgi:hypothetical protein